MGFQVNFHRESFGKFVILSVLAAVLFSGSSWSRTGNMIYQIMPGDTVGEVLRRLGVKHLWGDQGGVAQTIELNPTLNKRRGNLILPGKKIELPVAIPLADQTLPVVPSEPEYHASSQENVSSSWYSLIGLAPVSEYSRFDAQRKETGGNASVSSKQNFGFEANWSQVWTRAWSTQVYVRWLGQNNQTPSGTTLTQSTNSSTALGVLSENQLFDRFTTQAGIGMAPVFSLLPGLTGTNILLDQAEVLRVDGNIRYDVYVADPFRVSVLGGLALFGPKSTDAYSLDAGFQKYAKLILFHEMKRIQLEGAFYWRSLSQNTGETIQSRKDLGVEIGMRWRLGQ